MKKDYTKYDPIKFAQDGWFIKWVKSEALDSNEFWEKWLASNPDKAKDVEEAKKLVQALRLKEEAKNEAQEKKLWDRIEADISTEAQTPARISRLKAIRWISYAAAACVALFLVFYFLGPANTTVKTPNGAFATEMLPDGSSVQLNAGSKVVFNKNKWEDQRLVKLEGEAFFEVKKGEQFTVNTPQGSVSVLGTSFNVLARGNEFEVTCFTGKVRVESSNGKTRVLTEGQHTRALNGAELSEVQATDLDKKAGWRQRSFYYVDYPITKVFSEVERQFDINIEMAPEVDQIKGNFIFETNHLDSTLQKICWPSRLEYEIKGDVVKITK